MSTWFPKNISTFGGELDAMFWLIFYIVGAGFIVSEAIILFAVFRHRKKAGQRATYLSGERMSEFAWVLVPTALVLFIDLGIDLAGAKAWDKVKGEIPATDVHVLVTGKQFNWVFTYPGPDAKFGTEDDLALENELHVPVNKPVRLTLKSDDVIHSFFVPTLRLKQDVVPGREIPAWFEATATGDYEIACAELCGYGHYTMRGFLYIHTPEEYSKWLAERWPSS